jgi:hypothetical protein
MTKRDCVRLIAAILLLECFCLGLAWLGVRALDTEADQPIRSAMYR